jgi:predicted metal-dependent enzyme (double-stranded beta helix superfamily)
MFDVDELVAGAQHAVRESEPRLAVRDLLDRVLAEPGAIADALRPSEGGITLLHTAFDLTVLHAVWAPGMTLFPHDHRMWAVIGIYTGQENNAFFRRAGADQGALVETGGKELDEKSVLVLGDDVIHSVSNPLDRLTGAIHIYGGNFVTQPRSAWGPGPLTERPHSMDVLRQQFEEANDAWRNATSRD